MDSVPGKGQTPKEPEKTLRVKIIHPGWQEHPIKTVPRRPRPPAREVVGTSRIRRRPWWVTFLLEVLLPLIVLAVVGWIGFTHMHPSGNGQTGNVVSNLAVNHWVSATPGDGLRYWDKITEGRGWFQFDVDLRIEGNTGTIVLTFTAVHNVPGDWETGNRFSVTIVDVRDDGTTIDFIIMMDDRTTAYPTYEPMCHLTRTSDGHLKGSYHYSYLGGESIDVEGTTMGTVETDWEGTLDLVPAP
jgi:hypothetical protein